MSADLGAPADPAAPFDPTAVVRRLRRFADDHQIALLDAQRLHVTEGVIARLNAAAGEVFVLRGAWRHRPAPALLSTSGPAFWMDGPLGELRPILQSALCAPRADGVLIDTDVLDFDVFESTHRRAAKVWIPARFAAVTGLWITCWPGRPMATEVLNWESAAGVPMRVRAVAPAAALAEHLADVCAPEALRWAADDLWCLWRGLLANEASVAEVLDPLATILARRGRDTEVLDRLRRRRLGQSRDSRRVWAALASEGGRGTLQPLPEVVAWLAERLNGTLPPRTPRPVQPPAARAAKAAKH